MPTILVHYICTSSIRYLSSVLHSRIRLFLERSLLFESDFCFVPFRVSLFVMCSILDSSTFLVLRSVWFFTSVLLFPPKCIDVFRMILAIHSDYFSNSINRLVFIMKMQCVCREVRSEF